ncbi:nicotinate-nicotinamide nucleotide adenylyltransferase, partial [Xanthomonas sacchari]|uniref:nicotinate-nicotinamide nucleotide adenylyltransferase n=1 Tax=Xanthomonas sacchari TaxID=56458 RepID=UPI00225E6F6F
MTAGIGDSGLGIGNSGDPERAADASRIPNPESRPLALIYGGTFDPIHNGHLAIARAARDAFGVPVRLMPAADPPHRPAPGADAQQRCAMLALAIADTPGLVLDLHEVRRAQARPGVASYSIDTVRELRAELGADAPLALLIGSDSFVGFNGWR